MTEPIRTPDFIVVGAPKCGTTALHHYLRAQPRLFVPAQKEPHFFCPDVPLRRRLTQAEYLRLFSGAPADRAAGEVSVWYLYSQRAAQAIRDLCGPIRIVALLRDPVEAMRSLHAQLVYNGDEDLLDFGEALAAEAARQRGERVPSGSWLGAACFCYRRIYSYAAQVERYVEAHGAENVRCVLYDDLVRDPAATLAGVAAFLGVDAPAPYAPGRVNPRRQLRLPWLRALYRRHEQTLRRGARRVLRPDALRHAVGRRVLGWVKGAYGESAPPPPVDPTLRRQLCAELAPDVRRLAALIGRDLEPWLAQLEVAGAPVPRL